MRSNMETSDEVIRKLLAFCLHYDQFCLHSNELGQSGNCSRDFFPPENVNCSKELFPVEYWDLNPRIHGEGWTEAVVQRVVMLAVIITVTLFGNLTIIIVLSCSRYRKLNSRVNIFIINLAIGDLTVCLFTMTTEILFAVFDEAWIFGGAACKIMVYFQIVTLAGTCFILTTMSYDRYVAICKPLRFGNTASKARKMILVSWIMAFIFASPQLLIFQNQPQGIYPDGEIQYKCKSTGYTHWWQRKLYFTFMTTYILVIPAIFICFCYINVVKVVWRQGGDTKTPDGIALRRSVVNNRAIPRAKVRTIKMTLSIICSFIMCWTPYFVVHLIHIWNEYKVDIPDIVFVIAEVLATVNSALNPILYGCFNIKMKRGLFEVFCPNRLPRRANPFLRTDAGRLSRSSVRAGLQSNSYIGPEENQSLTSAYSRSKENIITEQNRNGYKLRVRFLNDGKTCTSLRAVDAPPSAGQGGAADVLL